MQRSLAWVCVLVFVFGIWGCSIQKIAVKETGGIIAKGMPVFFQESDLGIAETAIASNIKLLETLLATAPDDKTLLLATSQALTAYAFGFVEAEMERTRYSDPKRSEAAKERAKSLYARGREYALRAVKLQNKKLVAALDGPLADFDPLLPKVSKKQVPAIFWLSFSWGGLINLSKDSITAVADIVKVEHMMKRVLELDETFFNAGPHMFLGIYYGSRPKMFGGDPALSQVHFDRVDSLTGNRLLMNKVMRAQFLAVQNQDRKMFESLLGDVRAAKDDLYPEQRLMNEIAKSRAEILSKQEEKLF